MLKLPKLYKKLGLHALEDLCDTMGLQARGSKGEHSPPGPGFQNQFHAFFFIDILIPFYDHFSNNNII